MLTFKGAAKKLENIDLPRIGHEIGVGEDEIHAILDVESSGSGFDAQGRPKALYEPHLAYRFSSGGVRDRLVRAGLAYPKQGTHPYPKESYTRILAAQAIDETIALKATSWGLGQVLGSNFAAAGYKSPQEMVQAFCDSEAAQLRGVINFIKANGLANALRTHDWVKLARGYNGQNEAAHNYHGKLSAAFRHWQGIQDTPFAPETLAAAKEASKEPEAVAGPTPQQQKEPEMANLNPIVSGLLKNAVSNPNVLHAGAGFLRGFVQKALAEKGVPENLRQMLHSLGDNAETAVVAMVAGSAAEKEIPHEVVAKAKEEIHAAPAAREQGGVG